MPVLAWHAGRTARNRKTATTCRRSSAASRPSASGHGAPRQRRLDAVPPRYRAAIWLGAAQGCRLSEALGMEHGARCVGHAGGELHIIQQLRYAPAEYGGSYLCAPKAGSAGTIDLDLAVSEVLTEHVRQFPPVEVDLVDVLSGEPARRVVPLLFTTTRGYPFTDRTWSREWADWHDKLRPWTAVTRDGWGEFVGEATLAGCSGSRGTGWSGRTASSAPPNARRSPVGRRPGPGPLRRQRPGS
jgi:hypothetical protein